MAETAGSSASPDNMGTGREFRNNGGVVAGYTEVVAGTRIIESCFIDALGQKRTGMCTGIGPGVAFVAHYGRSGVL
jgi:hypothetical protein